MPRFFVEKIERDVISLTGENYRHAVKSLRMRAGEIITLSDANGIDCEGRVEEITDSAVSVRVLETRQNTSEPDVEVVLFQALPKVGKMETIIQKAVELGVSSVVPILTSRCVSRPDGKTMEKKRERYQKVALEAAKQSGRGAIPVIGALEQYDSVLEKLPSFDQAILFYEEGGLRVGNILPPGAKRIAVIIGSEGGFSREEVDRAVEAGAAVGSLGPRILRCETAPVAALSLIMYETGNLEKRSCESYGQGI